MYSTALDPQKCISVASYTGYKLLLEVRLDTVIIDV